MKPFHVKGSLVALITPFNDDYSIDWKALQNLVEWHVDQQTSAIVSVGTTGESPTLSNSEHIEVIGKTIEYAQGRLPIVAGTGANSTEEAIYLTQEAYKLGASASLLVTPYYNRPTQAGLYAHFRKIAESVAIPQIMYNVPSRTGCDLENETALKLAQIDNIVGIKDATGDMGRAKFLIANAADDFLLYSGDDGTAREFIHQGGHGCISVAANCIPKMFSLLCDTAVTRPLEAMALQTQLDDFFEALRVEPNPVPIKWVCHKMGLCGPVLRLPLVALSKSYHQSVLKTLSKIGIQIHS